MKTVQIRFTAKGHPHMRISHKSTFEITKDEEVTPAGDCIVACSADFDPVQVKEFLESYDVFTVRFECGGVAEEVNVTSNKDFDDERELVFRLGSYSSPRTAGIDATKAAKHFNEDLRKNIQKGSTIIITFIPYERVEKQRRGL